MALLERGLLIAGVALFAVLLYQIGVAAVWVNLRLIGWGFAFILGQELLAIAANAVGWYWAFSAPRPPVPFRLLFAARIAGDAINNVTPTATVGGEVVRVRLLDGHVDSTAAWASVAIAKLSQTFSQIGFVVIGLLFVLDDISLPAGFQQGLFVGLTLLGTGFAIAVALQRRGMFTAAINLARRLGLPVPARIGHQLQVLDAEIARFYRTPWAFLGSTAFFLLGWFVGVIEIYLILLFLDVGANWHRALTIEVLSVAVDAVLFFVPARAGTQEGSKVLIFTAMGLDAAKGLSLGIARRIRELGWALVGLAIMSHHQARQRRAAP